MEQTNTTKREQILQKRAEALALVAEDTQPGEQLDVTVFSIGTERFAIVSTLVQEIVSSNSLMPLPCVPAHIAGIFNLRGKLMAAVDLRRLLGIAGETALEEIKLVVLHDNGMEFGLVADEINGVLSLNAADIQDASITQNCSGSKYLRGVTSNHLVLLDGMGLIHDPDLIVNDETN